MEVTVSGAGRVRNSGTDVRLGDRIPPEHQNHSTCRRGHDAESLVCSVRLHERQFQLCLVRLHERRLGHFSAIVSRMHKTQPRGYVACARVAQRPA